MIATGVGRTNWPVLAFLPDRYQPLCTAPQPLMPMSPEQRRRSLTCALLSKQRSSGVLTPAARRPLRAADKARLGLQRKGLSTCRQAIPTCALSPIYTTRHSVRIDSSGPAVTVRETLGDHSGNLRPIRFPASEALCILLLGLATDPVSAGGRPWLSVSH